MQTSKNEKKLVIDQDIKTIMRPVTYRIVTILACLLLVLACARDDECDNDGDRWCKNNTLVECTERFGSGIRPYLEIRKVRVCDEVNAFCQEWEPLPSRAMADCVPQEKECPEGHESTCQGVYLLGYCDENGVVERWVNCAVIDAGSAICEESDEGNYAFCR